MNDNEINRRELLKKISLYMGCTVSTPIMSAILSGCADSYSNPKQITGSKLPWSPVFLSGGQAALVHDMAEVILPRTDTPGAADVGVPKLIDRIIAQAFTQEQQARYAGGLDAFANETESAFTKTFIQLPAQEKKNLVSRLNRAALDNNNREFSEEQKAFYKTTKELTLLGFFRSQVGATQVLQYVPVPGEYKGCVPLKVIGRAWATG